MPLIYHKNLYEGFIRCNGRRYFIKAFVPNAREWDPKTVMVDWRLQQLLKESLSNFIEANCHWDFVTFFKRLENFVTSSLGQDDDGGLMKYNPRKVYNFLKNLEGELIQIQEYIKDIDVEEEIIQIECTDAARRKHQASLLLTQNYPKEPIKIISHNLPIQDETSLYKHLNLKSISTISGFCKRFTHAIECFQDFWNTLSILDAHCWILDPEKPEFKDTTRRIKISDRLSVVLVFNPYMSRHRPDIKFLGCHSDVAELREKLQKNLQNEVWDPAGDILTNLMNVLEVEFPTKNEMKQEDSLNLVREGECAICFMIRLNNELPSEICDNVHCMSQYHALCLFKYLSSIPGNKNFFGRIQGECPNCEEIISCPVPKFD